MAEYIDRKATLALFQDIDPAGNHALYMDEIRADIQAIPTADVVERKTGKWIDGYRAGYGESLYWFIYCSECLHERDDDDHEKDTPFCPNCGCKMEVEHDDV